MKVAALVGETATAVVDVGPGPEDVVKVIYRPGALTLETAEELKVIQASDFPIDSLLALLKPMLVEWDLEQEDGSQLPCTEETIKKVPLGFLGQLVETITTDNRPTLDEGKVSGDTSPQEVGSVTPLGGSQSSERLSSMVSRPGSF